VAIGVRCGINRQCRVPFLRSTRVGCILTFALQRTQHAIHVHALHCFHRAGVVQINRNVVGEGGNAGESGCLQSKVAAIILGVED